MKGPRPEPSTGSLRSCCYHRQYGAPSNPVPSPLPPPLPPHPPPVTNPTAPPGAGGVSLCHGTKPCLNARSGVRRREPGNFHSVRSPLGSSAGAAGGDMDRGKRLSTGSGSALLLTALLLLESERVDPSEDVAELPRQRAMVLLGRRLEIAVRNGRNLQVASRIVAALEWTEMKRRQKLAELAEQKVFAICPSDHRKFPSVNRWPQLKTKKRVCFWKYCI
ncbi:uncharacterized protein [Narcine bancroftii]|uniref:uncharacterized protein n=1 Tax=Narcine bancroftii TaxID=1343680 RepID=UPI00383155AE